ncbi:hypothetical protein CLU79DRAFT_776743 [Phycomyces nitens]|nr:hypothetical protein CLU79DRAFT_776743 [Phycomyces nitens]
MTSKHIPIILPIPPDSQCGSVSSVNENQDKTTRWPVERCLFCLGFIVPPAWFIGSSDCGCWFVSEEGAVWKKRCRISTTLLLTCLIVTAAVVMIFKPSTFGLRSLNSSVQTSSTLDTAVRPGVPMNGSNDWGDALAGTVISPS